MTEKESLVAVLFGDVSVPLFFRGNGWRVSSTGELGVINDMREPEACRVVIATFAPGAWQCVYLKEYVK